jgi:hypothetical protein
MQQATMIDFTCPSFKLEVVFSIIYVVWSSRRQLEQQTEAMLSALLTGQTI